MHEGLLTAGGEAQVWPQVTHSKNRDSIDWPGRQCVIIPKKGNQILMQGLDLNSAFNSWKNVGRTFKKTSSQSLWSHFWSLCPHCASGMSLQLDKVTSGLCCLLLPLLPLLHDHQYLYLSSTKLVYQQASEWGRCWLQTPCCTRSLVVGVLGSETTHRINNY